jgi:hypothetical protein
MKGFYTENGISYPEYPNLGATVAKFRPKVANSIYDIPREERVAYANAIEEAIRAKHRRLHMKPNPPTTPGWYTPPPVTRLLKYDKPIKMQGDPNWIPKCDCRRYGTCECDHWEPRQRAVYAAAMEAKRASA